MIVYLLALGLLQQEIPPVMVETPASRTIVLPARTATPSSAGPAGIPDTAPIAEEAMDSSTRADFVIDLANLLDEGETFEAVTFAVAPAAVLQGLMIIDEPPRQPVALSNTRVRIWLAIAPNMVGNQIWRGAGTLCGIEFTGETSGGRTHQSTCAVRIVEK